jgi:hypothetical protein
MILEGHYPVHKHPKGVTLPQFPGVNEVNLKSVSEILRENWLSAAFLSLSDGVLLHESKAGLAVPLDMILGVVGIRLVLILAGPIFYVLLHLRGLDKT